jgi:hypothetical protein
VITDEPSPYQQYYYWDQQSQKLSYYEPSPVVWTDYYVAPEVDLYYYDQSTGTYNHDDEPSPSAQYYYLDDCTDSFVPYSPVAPAWTVFYEEPSVELYQYNE